MSPPSLKAASPTPAKPLDYAQPLSLGDRMARHLPAREHVTNFLKNLIWVAPLTLLIWVYAEREQTFTLAPVTVPIEVRTNDHNRLVTLRGPADKNLVVELSGPRARVDRLNEQLQPQKGNGPVQIDIDPQIGSGNQHLSSVTQLNNLPLFKNNGVTVKNAQPAFLVVDVDTFREVDVPVKVPPDAEKQIVDQTTYFIPNTVKLRAPSHLIEEAERNGQLFVYADVAKREEFKTRTGPQKLENVPIYWMANGRVQRESVSFSTPAVTANLDIRPRDIRHRIDSVPVYQETPAGFNERFRVEYAATIPNVEITGTAEQVAAVKSGQFKVKARLELAITDEDRGRKPLKFELPPGVSLTPETAARAAEWQYTLTPRQ